jgi:hypothetical protein
MQKWVRAGAEKLGFIVVVVKSNNGCSNRKTYVLNCDGFSEKWRIYVIHQQETESYDNFKMQLSI